VNNCSDPGIDGPVAVNPVASGVNERPEPAPPVNEIDVGEGGGAAKE
jgi:hypothetical protein